MQLHPREQFTIVRQLNNPYITDTFYVRAVIRNAKTDTIIDTLNLTDKTGQRFTKNWLVPADVSGQGFWVSIVTSVYTDSGYTTKSENYGDEENTYLIQDRFNHNLGGTGGGGPDIDYKKIKKMIDQAVKEIITVIPEENNIITEKTTIKEVKIPEVKIVEQIKVIEVPKIIEKIKFVDNPIVTEKVITVDMSEQLKNISDKIDEIIKEDEVDEEPEPVIEEKKPDMRLSRLLGTSNDLRVINLTKK